MISGVLTVEAFGYQAVDTEGKKVVNGRPTDESVPVKILVFQDKNSQTRFAFTFSIEEFENFVANISGKKIVESVGFIPPINLLPPPGRAHSGRN